MQTFIKLNERDNVGVCLEECGNIPAGHKYALCDINKGEYVIKYGEIIGKATADIKSGEWVCLVRYLLSRRVMPHVFRR